MAIAAFPGTLDRKEGQYKAINCMHLLMIFALRNKNVNVYFRLFFYPREIKHNFNDYISVYIIGSTLNIPNIDLSQGIASFF